MGTPDRRVRITRRGQGVRADLPAHEALAAGQRRLPAEVVGVGSEPGLELLGLVVVGLDDCERRVLVGEHRGRIERPRPRAFAIPGVERPFVASFPGSRSVQVPSSANAIPDPAGMVLPLTSLPTAQTPPKSKSTSLKS